MGKLQRAVGVFLVACAVSIIPQVVYAVEVPDVVRIGLKTVCYNQSSTTISGSELLIGYEDDGDFEEEGSLTSSSSFKVTPMTGEFVEIDDKFDQDDAEDVADDLCDMGYDAYATYLGDDGWVVYVEGSSASKVESASGYDADSVSGFSGYLVEGSKSSAILSTDNDACLMGVGSDDTFTIGGSSYRGMLTFAVSGSSLTAVNVIDMEEYLYGVVPAEMGEAFPTEALKAQAVAARTYTIYKMGGHTSEGFSLCDGVCCQVYDGYDGEYASTTKAVDATEGEIMTYNNEIVQAVFSASAGGYTENSEDVWWATVPYLRAVPELVEYSGVDWTKTISENDLNDLVDAKGENVGWVDDIVITKLADGGRVQEIQLVGSKGSVTLDSDGMRTYFSASSMGYLPSKMFTINGEGGDIGVFSADGSTSSFVASSGGSLMSAAAKSGIVAKTVGDLYGLNGTKISLDIEGSVEKSTSSFGEVNIEDVYISTASGGKFVFVGYGNGHGVGLSQKGASAMASAGYDYDEILLHYYTGVTIED